jgi:hypothetical protein
MVTKHIVEETFYQIKFTFFNEPQHIVEALFCKTKFSFFNGTKTYS